MTKYNRANGKHPRVVVGKGKNKKMSLSYMKTVILRQVREGQYQFSHAMYENYKAGGGKSSYRSIIAPAPEFNKENALYHTKY